jgi:lipopolysaccharide transport protein LptA
LQNTPLPVINGPGQRSGVILATIGFSIPTNTLRGFVEPIQYKISSKHRILSRWLFALTVTAFMAGATLAAGETKNTAADQNAEDQPISITADQLISDNEKKFAEFIGNVRATQADFVITSDKLRIYYQGELIEAEDKTNKDDNADMLKKIIAEGNVKIKSSQYTAQSDKVEYDTGTMTITMTGEDSKVISGKNSIAGSKIILYRKDGRIKVLRGKKKRVEATFYSGGKASDAFKLEKPKE